jgi:hypothetical protein
LPPSNALSPRPKAGFAMRAECRRAGKLSTRSVGIGAPASGTASCSSSRARRPALPLRAADMDWRTAGCRTNSNADLSCDAKRPYLSRLTPAATVTLDFGFWAGDSILES